MKECLSIANRLGFLGVMVWPALLDGSTYLAAVFEESTRTPHRTSWRPFPSPEEAVADLARRLKEELG